MKTAISIASRQRRETPSGHSPPFAVMGLKNLFARARSPEPRVVAAPIFHFAGAAEIAGPVIAVCQRNPRRTVCRSPSLCGLHSEGVDRIDVGRIRRQSDTKTAVCGARKTAGLNSRIGDAYTRQSNLIPTAFPIMIAIEEGYSARSRSQTARGTEGPDLCGVGGSAGFQVVAYIPEGAIVAGIDRGGGIVFPSERCGLRRFAFRENRFMQRHDSRRIRGHSCRETLTRKMGRSAIRITDSDIPIAIHTDASHPAIETIGGIGALLEKQRLAFGVQSNLIPADAPAAGGCVNRMQANNGLPTIDVSINQALHQLVALSI